ncbi:hypothetical protein ISS08_02395 [Candidatus Pacearchaeota archaeon]|nr:hypothetical protein [Candidatus Pacearchaeota archaeon]
MTFRGIPRKTSTEKANEILKEAMIFKSGKKEEGYGSPEFQVDAQKFQVLLEANPDQVYLNHLVKKRNGTVYDHVLIYEGHTFSTGTFSKLYLPKRPGAAHESLPRPWLDDRSEGNHLERGISQ